MDWMVAIGEAWLSTLGWLAGLAVVFGLLACLTPCNPGMFWWKDLRAVGTDLLYWFVSPLFLRVGRILMLIAGLLLLFGGKDPQLLPVKGLPLWQQGAAILLIQDILMYWLHRLFHTRLAWKFHAVHHSPKVLDWMSASRFHLLNHLLEFGLADIAVLLMGFSPAVLLALAPFHIIYSALVHANLNWTFGPFRYVFASPVFHRWHHTMQEEGLDKNFASTFPFLDLVFGTFFMPRGRLPERFGTGEPGFPEGFWGQFIHPFKNKDVRHSPPIPPMRMTMRALTWTRRHPAVACLSVIGMLAAACLLGGGIYFTKRSVDGDERLAREGGRAETVHHSVLLDRAQRAWAENDLVRATALMDEAANLSPPISEPRSVPDPWQGKCLTLAGHPAGVLSVGISGDGQSIVSAGEDGMVKVWDGASGQEKFTLTGHARRVPSVAISADGRRIVSGSHDKTVKVWDATTGREERTLTGHTGAVLGVGISGDGQTIVSGSADGTIKVWDAPTGRTDFTLAGHVGAVLSVAISADGLRIVSASGRTATLWDARTGREVCTLNGHTDLVYGVAISPDGHRIASGSFDERVKVWEAATGREDLNLAGHTGPVYGVAIGPDGKRLVSGGKDGTVRVWDATTGRQELNLKGHTAAVTSVAVSGDGQSIVSGSRDGTIKVWDAGKCKQAITGGEESMSAVGGAASP